MIWRLKIHHIALCFMCVIKFVYMLFIDSLERNIELENMTMNTGLKQIILFVLQNIKIRLKKS